MHCPENQGLLEGPSEEGVSFFVPMAADWTGPAMWLPPHDLDNALLLMTSWLLLPLREARSSEAQVWAHLPRN